MAKKAQPKGIKKIKQQTFVIDCSKPVEDKIMEIASLQKFLTDKIKVNGKTGRHTAKMLVLADILVRILVRRIVLFCAVQTYHSRPIPAFWHRS